LLAGVTQILSAQGGRGAPQDGAPHLQAPLKISVTTGGQTYEFNGVGRCIYAPKAAWFKRLGEHWVVQVKPAVNTGLRSFGLNVWHLSDGDREWWFELFLAIDRSDRRISTLDGATDRGSGTVTVTPRESGGRLELKGKTKEGIEVQATAECEQFRSAGPPGR
jgi:hypothetical protein